MDMCFSASTSFTAAACLSLIGIAIFKRGVAKPFRPLALVPFIFAIQQLAEGVSWHTNLTSLMAENTFLFIAFCVWPIWMPYAFLNAETDFKRKTVDHVSLGLGIAIALFLLTIIPLTELSSCSFAIHYEVNLFIEPLTQYALGLIYMGAVLIPFLVSRYKGFPLIGVLLFLTSLSFFYIDQVWFISLWCFLAALISVSFIFVIPKKGEN